MRSAASPLWRITEGCNLLWKTWGDEAVVLNTGSGFTHVLDALSASVLSSLQHEPATIDQLAARLKARLDSPVLPAELAEYLDSLMRRLEELGLAECVVPRS
jgi:PqqD family protein of HPr-rel-A system